MNFVKSICLFVPGLLFIGESHAQRDDFLIKLRGGYLSSEESVQKTASGTLPTQKFDKGITGELALGYFFHDNIGVEVSGGYAQIDYSSAIQTNKVLSAIPLAASMQFRLPVYNTVFPYVGVGYSYKFFFQNPTGTKIKDNGNIVYQAGVDIINPNTEWGFNIDFKYVPKVSHDITENNEVFKNKMNSMSITAGVVVKF